MKAINKKINLASIIINDILKNQKISLSLILLSVVTVFFTIHITTQIRAQILVKEQLILEKDVLESEWRNLLLEENVLADTKRIERKSEELNLKPVTLNDESVIFIKHEK